MKLRDIMKAQERYNELSEEIKGLISEKGEVQHLYIRADYGGQALSNCMDQLQVKIEASRKERDEIEI